MKGDDIDGVEDVEADLRIYVKNLETGRAVKKWLLPGTATSKIITSSSRSSSHRFQKAMLKTINVIMKITKTCDGGSRSYTRGWHSSDRPGLGGISPEGGVSVKGIFLMIFILNYVIFSLMLTLKYFDYWSFVDDNFG